MKVLAVISQKGGVGKTTLAWAIATLASETGQAAILDLDPQASALFAARAYSDADGPAAASVPLGSVSRTLAALRRNGCALAVIDTPPALSDAASEAAASADFVLVPCRPSPFDLDAATRTIAVARKARRPFAVCLTQCPPARSPEIGEAAAYFVGLGAPLAPPIGARIAHQRAIAAGKTVAALDPGGLAATEMAALYHYITQQLYS